MVPLATAIPTIRNRTPRTRRNHPPGSIVTPSLLTSLCPTSAIRRSMPESPSAYAMRSANPIANDAGSTLASTTKYVGLQLENTGPSAAPINTSPQKEFCRYPAPSNLLDSRFNTLTNPSRSHNCGNTITMPNRMRITPEMSCHVLCGMLMKTVLTLRSTVNKITERPSDAVMVYARLRLPPATDPPTITGRSGSTHGASALKTPAMNEMKKRITVLLYSKKIVFYALYFVHVLARGTFFFGERRRRR